MRLHRALLRPATRRAALVAVSALLVACDPLASFEPQIITDSGLFALQAQDVDNTTATVTYTWTNSQAQARVHHSTTTAGAGSASIRILDAAGAVVYSNALLTDATHATAVGVPGSWTITVTMTGFTGTLGFHILAGLS
jgi:hypothetical protein